MNQTTKACIAEFIATFTLVFIGAGAICLDAYKGGGVGLVGIALAHGLAIAVMVASIGHISGGHINPAVTIAAWLTKKIGTSGAIGYIVAQLAGASLGAFTLKHLYPTMVAAPVLLGTPQLDATFPFHHGVLVEALLTFLVVFVIFGSAIDAKGSKSGWLMIGLTVAMDILMGGPITGAAMNPARAFGPALVTGFWTNQSVYWIGPIVGGAIAGLLYNNVFLRNKG